MRRRALLTTTAVWALSHRIAAQTPGPLRLGRERLAIPDPPRHREWKRTLFERLNADRVAHGVAPLAWEPRASLVGDRFCLDSALGASFGHWDPTGQAPYVRWARAGGVDYHAENVGAYSISTGKPHTTLLDLALESHQAMMDERPPDDGHRRTILDPTLTHVGIGLAAAGGEVRVAQEFTRVGFEWIEVPAAPVKAGALARFAAQPLQGREIGLVEIRHEPPAVPLQPRDSRLGGSYGFPPIVRALWPRTAGFIRYADGSQGDFPVRKDGSFEIGFFADRGPGFYFVFAYLREAQGMMSAHTAAGIEAVA